MVKFVNTKFDINKKVTFSYGRIVFLLAAAFSIGLLSGLVLFFVKNQDFLVSQPQVLPAPKPAISSSPISTPTPTLIPTAAPSSGNSDIDSSDLLGYWFTPHAATRNITFLKDNQFRFNDGKKAIYTGEFIVNGFIVTLKFSDEKISDIVLKFSQDQNAKYLENNEGELFVKQ